MKPSPYYLDPNLRRQEIQSQNPDIPIESAHAYLADKLQEYVLKPYGFTELEKQALIRLLAELALEGLRQNPQTADYRAISPFKAEYAKKAGEERLAVYNAAIRAEWELVRQRYESTNRLTIELPLYCCEPILLNPISEQPVTDWAIRPAESLGMFRCFDVEAEAQAEQTAKEVNSDPYTRISIGHLRAFNWDSQIYAKSPEPLYQSYLVFLEERLNAFRATHGGQLTPQLTFKVSDKLMQTVGGDMFLCGWRVTIKALTQTVDPPTEQPIPSKKSLLERIRALA